MRQDFLIEEIEIAEKNAASNSGETMRKLAHCFNLKDQYLSLDDEGRKNLLITCFREISAMKGEWKTNKGKGKLRKADGLNFLWNEPFSLLLELGLDELDANFEGEYQISPKQKLEEASPNRDLRLYA